MTPKDTDSSPQLDTFETTEEVGSEGGTPGDLEHAQGGTGTGSEAGELWRPAETRNEEVPRDEAPPGRRSP